jgi:hypothetical protein
MPNEGNEPAISSGREAAGRSSEPTITQADSTAVDNLLDEVLGVSKPEGDQPAPEGGKTEKDVVQKPVEGTTQAPPVKKTDSKPPETKAEPGLEKKDKAAPEEKKTALVPDLKKKDAAAAASGKPEGDATGDKELDAIQPPRGMSPKSLEGWGALKTLAKSRGEKVQNLEAKVHELSGQVGKPDPELSKKLEETQAELKRMQTLFTHEKDPDFIEKYDKKIEANEAAIYGLLKERGMSEESIKKIKENGGIAALPENFWEEHILPKLPLIERKKLEEALFGNVKLSEERKQALEKVRENWQVYEQEKVEKSRKEFETYSTEMAKHVDAMTKDIPWAKPQEIPADATPEQKAKIEKENAFYQESEARFQAALYPASPTARVETALAACLSFKLADELAETEADRDKYKSECERLTEELEEIKAASITSGGGAAAPKDGIKPQDRTAMKDSDAIDAGLDEVLAR